MTPTQREMRAMVGRRWRERDAYGVWFWASWILSRWLPVAAAVLGLLVGTLIAGVVR